jgi:hypothetical protein
VHRDELKRPPGGEVEEYDKDAKPDSDLRLNMAFRSVRCGGWGCPITKFQHLSADRPASTTVVVGRQTAQKMLYRAQRLDRLCPFKALSPKLAHQHIAGLRRIDLRPVAELMPKPRELAFGVVAGVFLRFGGGSSK